MAAVTAISPLYSHLVLEFDPKCPPSLLPITKAVEDRKLSTQEVPQMCAYVRDLVLYLLEKDLPSVELVTTTGALLVAVTRKKTYWKALASDRGSVELLMDFVDHWKSLGIDSPEEYTPGGDNLRCLEEHLQFAHAKVCKEEAKQRAAAAAEAASYQQATSGAKAADAAPSAVPAPTNMNEDDVQDELEIVDPSASLTPTARVAIGVQLQESADDELLGAFRHLQVEVTDLEARDFSIPSTPKPERKESQADTVSSASTLPIVHPVERVTPHAPVYALPAVERKKRSAVAKAWAFVTGRLLKK